MKRFVFSLFLLSAGVATVADAAPIIVRSGEHDGFTRLTISLSAGSAWTLKGDGPQWRLHLDNTSIDLDLSQAFSRIGRDRIRELAHGAARSTMLISLNCPCDVQGFVANGDLLVIDVSDPEIPSTKAEPAPRYTEHTQTDLPVVLPRTVRSLVGGMIGQSFNAPDTGKPDRQDAENDARVSEAESRLIEQLSRAATQGIIDIKPSAVPQVPNEDTEPAGAVDTAAQAAISAVPNLRAHTAVDAVDVQSDQMEFDAFEDVACIDGAQLDIGEWGWPQGAAAGISHWRKQLFKEFDNPDPQAAQALAMLYLYYGFGAEARVIMSNAQIDRHARPALFAISHIVDLDHENHADAFAGQMLCDGPAALWALLESEESTPAQELNATAVIAAFQRLPAQLKQHLGPVLSDRMIQVNKPDEAERVQRILNRGTRHKSMTLELVEAELALVRDEPEVASEGFRRVVASGQEVSPRALVSMIDADLESGRVILPETADLAAAFAVENRATPIGSGLRRVHLLARAGAMQFSRALKGLEEIEQRDGSRAARSIRGDILKMIAEKASDREFLERVLTIAAEASRQLRPSVADAVADRLVSLGFPDEAEHFIGAPTPDKRARAMVAARADLVRRQPRRALARLGGYSGADIDELRARARYMATEYAAAQGAYESLGQVDRWLNSAWLAGDWTALVETENDLMASVAQLEMTPPSVQDKGDDAVLRQTRELLDASAASRDVLERLLERMQVSPVENDV